MGRAVILLATIVYFIITFGGTTPASTRQFNNRNINKLLMSPGESADKKIYTEQSVSERPLEKNDYAIDLLSELQFCYVPEDVPVIAYTLSANVYFPNASKPTYVGDACVSQNQSSLRTLYAEHSNMLFENADVNITRFSYHFLENFVENGNILYFRQPEKYGELRKWARGHLVPPNDFYNKPSRRVMYSLLNTAPRFSLLHTGRWCQLEGFVRTRILKVKYPTFVMTGTFGKQITTLKDPAVNFEIPVHQYFFKLIMWVENFLDFHHVFYVGINDPEYTKYSNCNGQSDVEPEYQNVCENQCPQIFQETENPETQCLVYCCAELPQSLPLSENFIMSFANDSTYNNIYPIGDEDFDGLCDCDAENENNSQDDTEFIKQECYRQDFN